MSALLPAAFTLEPATGALVAEVFELVAAEQTAAFGFCPETKEDVRSILEPPAAAASKRPPSAQVAAVRAACRSDFTCIARA